MKTIKERLPFLSEFDQNIMEEMNAQYECGMITPKQGMNRLNIVLSRTDAKNHESVLLFAPRVIVSALWSDLAKFGQVFGAGIRLQKLANEVLNATE